MVETVISSIRKRRSGCVALASGVEASSSMAVTTIGVAD
jgi:hypothetical protein